MARLRWSGSLQAEREHYAALAKCKPTPKAKKKKKPKKKKKRKSRSRKKWPDDYYNTPLDREFQAIVGPPGEKISPTDEN